METPNPKIAFITDLHVCEDRLEQHEDYLSRICEQIRVFEPDLILVGGDLAGTQVPHKATVAERNLIAATFARLAQDAPVIGVRGNHDFPDDYGFLAHFDAVSWIEKGPSMIGPTEDIVVFAMPWIDRSKLGAIDVDYGEALQKRYEGALESFAPDLAAAKARGAHVIMLGHAALKGGTIRDGQPKVATSDPVIDLAELLRRVPADTFDAGFFGHYHEPQTILRGFVYGGSTFINEYGESPSRGWTAWSRKDGFQFCPVSQRQKLMVNFDFDTGEVLDAKPFFSPTWKTVTDALDDICKDLASVKLVVNVSSPSILGDAKAVTSRYVNRLKLAGCDVTVSYNTATVTRTRAGAAEAAAASTSEDKFRVWVKSTDEVIPPDALSRALEMLPDLEAEADRKVS